MHFYCFICWLLCIENYCHYFISIESVDGWICWMRTSVFVCWYTNCVYCIQYPLLETDKYWISNKYFECLSEWIKCAVWCNGDIRSLYLLVLNHSAISGALIAIKSIIITHTTHTLHQLKHTYTTHAWTTIQTK